MRCEVVYAFSSDVQTLISLEIKAGISVAEAIQQSGILVQYPEIQSNPVGVFGKKIDPYKTRVKEGDRIEIYRSLFMDPKRARLLRVRRPAKQRAVSKIKRD